MAYQHTVQAGETLNGIVQGLGFSNYKAAGVSAVPSGNFDKVSVGDVIDIPNYTAGNAPTIGTTPPVISSKDVAGGFNSNSNTLDTKTTPPPTPTVADTKVDPNATTIEKNTDAQNKKDGVPASSGNPIFDSVEAQRKTDAADTEKAEADKVAAQSALLKTSLAAIDSTYASTLANIDSTYQANLATTKRINALNIDRTKAYGLATGNALSTPIEFTNAVSQRETEAAANISALDTQRNAAIAAAKAARDSGDAAALQSNIDKINQIETDMRSQLNDIATQATNRFNLLTKVADDQLNKQQDAAKSLLAAAALQNLDAYGNAKDDKAKDNIVKNIVASSGGQLKYSDVLGALQTGVSDAAKAKTQTAKDEADIAQSKASANASNASAAVNWAKSKNGGKDLTDADKKNASYATINDLLSYTEAKPAANGEFYTDKNGFVPPQRFHDLIDNAKEDGITRSDFLTEYGDKLYPGTDKDYAGYGLTQAEINKILGLK